MHYLGANVICPSSREMMWQEKSVAVGNIYRNIIHSFHIFPGLAISFESHSKSRDSRKDRDVLPVKTYSMIVKRLLTGNVRGGHSPYP